MNPEESHSEDSHHSHDHEHEHEHEHEHKGAPSLKPEEQSLINQFTN